MKTFEFFKKEAPLLLLSLLLVKSAISPHLVDAMGLLCLSALMGYFKYWEKKSETPVNDDIRQQIAIMREDIRTTRDKLENSKLASALVKRS